MLPPYPPGGGGDATSLGGIPVLFEAPAPVPVGDKALVIADLGGGDLRVIVNTVPIPGGGTESDNAPDARTALSAARAGIDTTASGVAATSSVAPTFTGTQPTTATVTQITGTGMTAAGQTMTSTDNQTVAFNALAGYLLATATANPVLLIQGNAACDGAPLVLTVLGTPVTDAGQYYILRAPTPAGAVGSHAHDAPSHVHQQTNS